MSGTNNPRGRPKGVVSKLVDELREELLYDANGNLIKENHPALFLKGVMLDETNALDLRMDAAKALLPYIQPKLKQMEITGADGGPIQSATTIFRTVRPERPDWGKTTPEPAPEVEDGDDEAPAA